jgi:CTP synthase (UTP-ammonia lyase)
LCTRDSPLDSLMLTHYLASVPHITSAIQDWVERVAKIPVDGSQDEPDVCVIELGTSTLFYPALKNMAHA